MIDASYLLSFGLYKITPPGEPTYVLDSPTNQAQDMYLCGQTTNTRTAHRDTS